jgi:ABC-2 type transport system ATP-binding protein
MPIAIEVLHLNKVYDGTTAVEDLSLSVPSGCLFGFLGPNGAGKSTTLGCLTGVLDPGGGAIRLLGEPMGRDAVAIKRRIGVMPETLGLFDALYAQEFLAFHGRMFGLAETAVRRRVGELLEALELDSEGGSRSRSSARECASGWHSPRLSCTRRTSSSSTSRSSRSTPPAWP